MKKILIYQWIYNISLHQNGRNKINSTILAKKYVEDTGYTVPELVRNQLSLIIRDCDGNKLLFLVLCNVSINLRNNYCLCLLYNCVLYLA